MIYVQFEGLEQIDKSLANHQKQIPFAVAKSLTRTAQATKIKLSAEIVSSFESPTAFTKNAIYFTAASKASPAAEVGIKDNNNRGTSAAEYLSAEVYGGARDSKKFERGAKAKGLLQPGEFFVPGRGARLNSSGNITKNQIIKALSSADENNKAVKKEFFFTRSTKGLPAGIFRRAGKSIKSFLIAVSQPNYSERFDFFGVAEKQIAKSLPEETHKVIDEVLNDKR